jgi:hypothetical protein
VGRRIGRQAHHLHLAREVLGAVEDLVEVGRQGVEVLGVERRRERLAQRHPELALGLVGAVFAVADGRGGGCVTARPGDERVHRLDRDRGLGAQHAE